MPLTYSIDEEQQQLSIDVVGLNNIVLKMRPLIKKAKVLVLRELALYIKRQKAKQSKISEDHSKRLGRKIINRLAEVRLLKRMNINKLCKLVLVNVNSHNTLEKGGETLTKQERIVIRISVCQEIAKFVKDFRDKHSDWPALVHYLLYKNTSGKWRTTEQKKKATKRKKKKGDLPLSLADLDVSEDGQVESTLQRFKAFKEAHDRELIEYQRRILEEEKAEIGGGNNSDDDGSDENQMEVDQDFHPSEINSNNPKVKGFISELLEKVNKGEKIDDSLLPGDELKDLPEPIEVDKQEKQKIQKPKMSKLRQEFAQSKEKVETEVVKSSPVQKPESESDGMLHEIIVEDVKEDEEASKDDDDDILGCDDVELKQELTLRPSATDMINQNLNFDFHVSQIWGFSFRVVWVLLLNLVHHSDQIVEEVIPAFAYHFEELIRIIHQLSPEFEVHSSCMLFLISLDELKERKAKPGDSAIYRRYIKQRNLHNLKNKSETSNFKKAGFRKGNFSAKPTSVKRTVSKEEPLLHPSWEAKRKQKARFSIPIKIVLISGSIVTQFAADKSKLTKNLTSADSVEDTGCHPQSVGRIAVASGDN
ncbi:hypothetical protein ACTXT7_006009 [Hymenolepis weldensis]